jgi:hypothetical protein
VAGIVIRKRVLGRTSIVRSESFGDSGEGHILYTRKEGETDDRGSVYASSGPTLPFLTLWHGMMVLCAVVVRSQ